MCAPFQDPQRGPRAWRRRGACAGIGPARGPAAYNTGMSIESPADLHGMRAVGRVVARALDAIAARIARDHGARSALRRDGFTVIRSLTGHGVTATAA